MEVGQGPNWGCNAKEKNMSIVKRQEEIKKMNNNKL
jgi:hypothetical protein